MLIYCSIDMFSQIAIVKVDERPAEMVLQTDVPNYISLKARTKKPDEHVDVKVTGNSSYITGLMEDIENTYKTNYGLTDDLTIERI